MRLSESDTVIYAALEEGKIEIALKMLEAGIDEAFINGATGLTAETLCRLQRAFAPE